MITIKNSCTIPNTFGIKACCHEYVEPETEEELIDYLTSRAAHPVMSHQPLLIIGGGSNLLFTKDYEGTVLHVAIKGIAAEETAQGVMVSAAAGENWDTLVDYCVEHEWYGLENLSLIPGEVGASAVQNIGAYGVEAKDFIHSVEVVEVATGEKVLLKNDDCDYAYRRSNFKTSWRGKYVVTKVNYLLSHEFQPQLDYGNIRAELERMDIVHPTAKLLREIIVNIRREKLPDPEVEGNAGSFFMNPVVDRKKAKQLIECYPSMPHYILNDEEVKIPAGWLIEQSGWKGRSLGRAGVHGKQALVLVNRGGATGEEILKLSETVRGAVKEKFGITIHPEVNIL